MKRMTVIIDRPEGSNADAAEADIARIAKALKPLGVRIRRTSAAGTNWSIAGYKAALTRVKNAARKHRRRKK